jgi:positive regulator of sigma E activity
MPEKYGIVISTNKSIAKISMSHATACSGDHDDCLWNAMIGTAVPKEFIVDAENSIGAVKGVWIEVSLSDSQLIKTAAVVYMLPLFISFIGAVFGYLIGKIFKFQIMLPVIIGGFVGLITGFYLVYFIDKHSHHNYVIKRIMDNSKSNLKECCKIF